MPKGSYSAREVALQRDLDSATRILRFFKKETKHAFDEEQFRQLIRRLETRVANFNLPRPAEPQWVRVGCAAGCRASSFNPTLSGSELSKTWGRDRDQGEVPAPDGRRHNAHSDPRARTVSFGDEEPLQGS